MEIGTFIVVCDHAGNILFHVSQEEYTIWLNKTN